MRMQITFPFGKSPPVQAAIRVVLIEMLLSVYRKREEGEGEGGGGVYMDAIMFVVSNKLTVMSHV